MINNTHLHTLCPVLHHHGPGVAVVAGGHCKLGDHHGLEHGPCPLCDDARHSLLLPEVHLDPLVGVIALERECQWQS